jgi:hypothetical protein
LGDKPEAELKRRKALHQKWLGALKPANRLLAAPHEHK